MKFFPIKIAIICLLITPVIYVASLTYLENHFNQYYTEQIQNTFIGDSKPLLEGSIRLEQQIARNIEQFVSNDWIIQTLKLKVKIQITSDQAKIIYPIFLDAEALGKELKHGVDTQVVAKENFDLLNSRFHTSVETSLGHGSRLANILLVIYFGISFVVFFLFYKKSYKRFTSEAEEKTRLISELKKEEQTYQQVLDELQNERQGLFENIKILNAKYQKGKEQAKTNEDELFEEIISLEGQLKSFIEMKKKRDNEITELKTRVEKYERRKSSRGRRNEFDFLEKRFSTLYKNVEMHRKAVSGFISLNDEQQIKAEEIIHSLDGDSDTVIIKRKVFSGKKHKTACFEVLFAYNGRLYFRKRKNNKIQLLVIGTKNTQSKDMEFLHGL